jgi:hypothetical protein
MNINISISFIKNGIIRISHIIKRQEYEFLEHTLMTQLISEDGCILGCYNV